MRWYNGEHRHSALKFVTPAERHSGVDIAVLRERKALYEKVKQARPERWSGATRNWEHCSMVWLNPVREEPSRHKRAA